MLRMTLLCAVAAVLAACANVPAQDAAQANAAAQSAPACGEAVTGSNIRRCSRDGSRVEVISGDDFERAQSRSTNLPRNPDSPRGR